MDLFKKKADFNVPDHGHVKWCAPSNIALIKYWGKKEVQLPLNPSLSFSLTHCHTITEVIFQKANHTGFEIYVDDVPNDNFRPKIETFFSRIRGYIPFLESHFLTIKTQNSFPHSSGIASSASGMAALALCLVDIQGLKGDELKQKASFLARLGSGSASRSVYGGFNIWGQSQYYKNSSDDYATPYENKIDNMFKSLCNTVLLIDKGRKNTSSSAGHALMHNHPFAAARYQQANKHIKLMQEALRNGDMNAFIDIVETEALTLHALMMSSTPNVILMKSNTLAVINKIKDFRIKNNIPVCFTLDAGANVHCIYPDFCKQQVRNFIEMDLANYCEDGAFIHDQMGEGAYRVS